MMAFHEQLTRVKNILGHDMNLLRIELKKTPFWNLIKVYDEGYMSANEGKKSDRQMHMFIECFNLRSKSSCLEIVLVVPNPAALSSKPAYIDLVQIISRMRPESQSPEYCFCLGNVTRIRPSGWPKDAARLLILYLFCTLLFASSGSTLGWSFVRCIESVEIMNQYNWAKGVRDYLISCLMPPTKNEQKPKARAISGCVTLIPYWICERTALINEIQGRERIDNAIEEKAKMVEQENKDDDFVNPPPKSISKSIFVKGRKQSRKRREEAKHTEQIESRPEKRVKKTQDENESQKKTSIQLKLRQPKNKERGRKSSDK
ncbi:hypothetical protein M0R45_002272 [Rubus argutus]|uniref:Aminotransferase-like plant mobile domain-containing protein n=1 Tax=Rubus argutus TaxID=59490 RepID=A0AAW1VJI5_RUBAR